jgi:hypothetical protein
MSFFTGRSYQTSKSIICRKFFLRTGGPISAIFDWLIDYLLFYVPLNNFSLICRRHHCSHRCRWMAAKFRPMLCAQGLWSWRSLYLATPTVTRDFGFSDLIQRTTPFSRLFWHEWGCRGSILTQILTELKSS